MSLSNFVIDILVLIISWFFMMWLANYLVKLLSKRLKWIFRANLEKNQWIMMSAVKLKNALMLLLGFWLFCVYSSEGAKEYDKFMASYKSPRQQRLDFLEAYCQQVYFGYELL